MSAKQLVFDAVARRQLKSGIDAGTRAVVAEIERLSIPVKGHSDIEHIAAIAANDPEIGQLLARAMEKVGHDGVITVEEGKSLKIEVEYTEGLQFDRGYISPYFVNDRRCCGIWLL